MKMRKFRALKRTNNYCGQCLFFRVDKHPGKCDDYNYGYCDLADVRVDNDGGACKHFKYDWEVNDDGNE